MPFLSNNNSAGTLGGDFYFFYSMKDGSRLMAYLYSIDRLNFNFKRVKLIFNV